MLSSGAYELKKVSALLWPANFILSVIEYPLSVAESACLNNCVSSLTLIIGFDKGFSSNIMYLNVFLVPSAMPQIYYPIIERARPMDLSCGSIRRYYLEKRYTKHVLLDSKGDLSAGGGIFSIFSKDL